MGIVNRASSSQSSGLPETDDAEVKVQMPQQPPLIHTVKVVVRLFCLILQRSSKHGVGLQWLDMDWRYLTLSCRMSLARPHRKSTTARGWTDIPIPSGRMHIRAGAVTSTRRWGQSLDRGLCRSLQKLSTSVARLVSTFKGFWLSKERNWIKKLHAFLALVQYCPHTVVDKDYYHTVTKVQRLGNRFRFANHSANTTPILSDPFKSFQTIRFLIFLMSQIVSDVFHFGRQIRLEILNSLEANILSVGTPWEQSPGISKSLCQNQCRLMLQRLGVKIP